MLKIIRYLGEDSHLFFDEEGLIYSEPDYYDAQLTFNVAGLDVDFSWDCHGFSAWISFIVSTRSFRIKVTMDDDKMVMKRYTFQYKDGKKRCEDDLMLLMMLG